MGEACATLTEARLAGAAAGGCELGTQGWAARPLFRGGLGGCVGSEDMFILLKVSFSSSAPLPF